MYVSEVSIPLNIQTCALPTETFIKLGKEGTQKNPYHLHEDQNFLESREFTIFENILVVSAGKSACLHFNSRVLNNYGLI